MDQNEPVIEATTGLKGWAGEFIPNPAHKWKEYGGTMEKGDISNVP